MPINTMMKEAARQAFKAHYEQGGAVKIEWDKTTQTPIIKHITPKRLYKDIE